MLMVCVYIGDVMYVRLLMCDMHIQRDANTQKCHNSKVSSLRTEYVTVHSLVFFPRVSQFLSMFFCVCVCFQFDIYSYFTQHYAQ